MVARTFHVDHNGEQHLIEYDTENGFEVLQIQIFSLTSIPPEKQKLLGEGNVIINSDADLEKITEKLHMLSIDEEETRNSSQSAMEKADEELARKLQEEEDGLFLAQFSDGQGRRAFEEKVFPMVENVRRYEDTNRQEAARRTTPIDELEEKSLVCLAKEGNFKPSKNEKDHAFLLQLLFWFKGSFMWVNSPPCDNCNRETSAIGIDAPLSSEVKYDATRVELFSCKSCQRVTRFPRYNDPIKLLETRRGRCGEWANCFTLYCRAFGYDARLVLDFTDHVWTECFSHHLGRWMHLDPCEGVFDNPLLYEKGWGKKLNYLIAFGKDGACDVTKRYTRKWPEVLSRRVITTEFIVSSVLDDITITCRKGYSQDMIEKLKDRDRKEAEDLQGQFSEDFPSISLPGRQSGSKEWRVARSEYGSDSLSTSSCPIRRCIDRHVRNIYSAFSSLLFQLVNSSVSQVETLEVMIAIRNLLGHLKRAPFHTRQASITLNSTASMPNMVPYIDEVVSSLSLKGARASDGTMSLYLDDDPVQTSLALPVALDCIDEIINRISECCNLDKSSLSLPLLKFNRISCGSVRASGEEIPCGIATSAFDGTNISKWEEPNGANGCWLIYYVANTKMVALGAYELMSANDAPERDPMDWVLEGSNDAGFNWFVLDEQKSQKFNKRFERKTYKLESTRNLSNAFRFRFLAVWNAKATSRFQIGSIDLYERED